MPLNLDLDYDRSDGDEIMSLDDKVEISTASQSVKPPKQSKSSTSPSRLLDDRPDYSSTTSGSEDGERISSLRGTKFFLSSDIAQGANDTTSTTTHAESQSKVVPKSILNRHNYSESTQRSASKSAAPEPIKLENKALKPVAQTSSKQIFWIDGDSLHSPESCPKPILKLIGNHLTEFEAQVLTARWPPHKTVSSDKGRLVHYVYGETKEKIRVARYHYGKNSQFFVVWIPGATVNDASEPAICKFEVFNGTTITLDGTMWKAVTWKTWIPRNVHRKSHVTYRCIPDKSIPKPNKAPRQQLASQSITDRLPYLKADRSALQEDPIMPRSRSTDVEGPFFTTQGSTKRKRAESIDLDDPGTSSKRPENGDIHGDTRGLGSSRTENLSDSNADLTFLPLDPPQNPHATRSATRLSSGQIHNRETQYIPGGLQDGRNRTDANKDGPSTIPDIDQHSAREPIKKGPNLSCIFRDKDGIERGIFPYRECDTAQKLFDVACVAQIAQIEPPATRLLKVSFESGAQGRLRPDNQSDYVNVFETELKKLIDEGGDWEWTVTISPYL